MDAAPMESFLSFSAHPSPVVNFMIGIWDCQLQKFASETN